MSMTTLAPAAAPDPADRPDSRATDSGMTVPYEVHDKLIRAALATLAAAAGGYPNPLGYLRDALDVTPRPGAHPREYAPVDPDDAVFGRW